MLLALIAAWTSASATNETALPRPQPACSAPVAECARVEHGAAGSLLTYSVALRSALQRGTAAQAQKLDDQVRQAQWESAQADYSPKPSISATTQRQLGSAAGTANSSINLTAGAQWQLLSSTRLQAQLQQTANRSPGSGASRQSTLVLELIQPLLRGAGAAARYPLDAARLADRVSQFTIDQALDNIFISVSQAFFDAVAAQQQVGLSKRTLNRVLQTKEVNSSLYDAGRVAKVELLQSDADIAQAELGLARARNAALASLSALLQLLGPEWSERQAAEVSLPDSLPAVALDGAPRMPDQLVSQALTVRAEMRIAQAALETARISLAKAEDESRPALDLRVGLASTSPSSLGSANSQSSVGLMWSVPLDRSPLHLQRTQARVGLERAELAFQNASRQVRSEVVAALRELEFAQAQQTLAANTVELNRRKLDAEAERFRAGKTSGFQLSAAQSELSLAEAAQIDAALTVQRALVEFDRASGTLTQRRSVAMQAP
jgi:outer membrane protein TolC